MADNDLFERGLEKRKHVLGVAPQRIATSGSYRPRPGDAERGIVRLGNWCGPEWDWEETAFP